MKRFLTYVIGIVACWLAINAVAPVLGLYKLHRTYPHMQQLSLKILRSPDSTPPHTVVVGCSNLQHNIDIRKIQRTLPGIDFMYFSGSQNSTFLQYISDAGMLDRYHTIVFYTPYQMFEKNNFLSQSTIQYESTASYDYVLNIIRHNPISFFYNWNAYFNTTDSIRAHQVYIPTATYDECVIARDHFVDSLLTDSTSFALCNEKFNAERHRVIIPDFGEEDIDFINAIPHRGQDIRIILSPIPNTKANVDNLARRMSAIRKLPNVLNMPPVRDSTLFYDQWYHLNKCGREMETDSMIVLLREAGL
ncbi:MAG: hypothetical protein JST83_15015 [Bacteroidetes bacterium]|nr:hypothetical protein [Bacteroidota bacterium]